MNLVFLLAVLCISCGKGKGHSNSDMQAQTVFGDAIYVATLSPLDNLRDASWGHAKINWEGDNFRIKVRLNDAANLPHIQLVHSGNRCPIKEDDVNRDGYLDVDEVFAASGRPYFPLDGDPGRRHFGRDLFPRGDYLYEQMTSYQLLLSDLKYGENEDQLFAQLKEDEELDLEWKVILIYGSRKSGRGKGFPGFSSSASVPIACGVFHQISHAMEIQYDPNFSRPLPRTPTHSEPRLPSPPPPEEPLPPHRPWYCRLTRLC